jgi:hypothetical protein
MAPPGIVVAIVPTAHENYLRLECSGTFARRNREP